LIVHPDTLYDAFAIAAPGLEPVVAAELKMLRATRLRSIDGGVEFRATQELLYTTNLHLRAASRIIVRLESFRAASFSELERRAARIPWETVVAPSARVRLRVTCRKSRLYHSDAVGERILEAIVARTNAVPHRKTRDAQDSPDEDAADAQLFIVRLDHDVCTISADTSGVLLHQRGYRRAVTQAPLRETLAAAMLLASGWDGTTPLVDPFCGSGTIPIEAALIARRIAPGRDRSFRFMSWPDFDAALWASVVSRAREAERAASGIGIMGSDRSGWAMRAAAGNAERAGVRADVRFEQHDAREVSPDFAQAGWIITNPPYGVRLGAGDELRAVYTSFGSNLRANFPRWHVGMLSTDRRLDSQIRVPMLERFRTTNGGLKVHFLVGVVGGQTDER
jgi:putative N6-adenine-specific DNA methylase